VHDLVHGRSQNRGLDARNDADPEAETMKELWSMLRVVPLLSLCTGLSTSVCVAQDIQTTGGVTYLTITGTFDAGAHIEVESVSRAGTNLTVSYRVEPGMILCIDCWHVETNAIVLGVLEPGWYSLCLSDWEFGEWTEPRTCGLLARFEVPVDSGPTLTFTAGAAAGDRIVRVAGVPDALYVLEESSDLLHWSGVCTNQGGPFEYRWPVSPGPPRFLRAKIDSGSTFTWL